MYATTVLLAGKFQRHICRVRLHVMPKAGRIFCPAAVVGQLADPDSDALWYTQLCRFKLWQDVPGKQQEAHTKKHLFMDALCV